MKSTCLLLLSVLLNLSGCQINTTVTGEEQFELGEQLYASYCANCHEVDSGIGPRLTPKVIATRVTAGALFRYNQMNMPYEAGNTLSEEEYWAITAFMLMRDRFIDRSTPLSPLSADTLRLSLQSPSAGI